MRIYIFFVILILGFTAAVTAAVNPEIFKKKYEEVRAPIDQYYAQKNAAIWEETRSVEYTAWMLKLRLPDVCLQQTTALQELECKQMKQVHQQSFAENWANKVKSGWKPAGVTD